MISERCERVLGGGLDMSALSVRTPGLQATTVLDAARLRMRGVTSLDGVRRNLFGCVDREENRRFVELELARQLEIDSQRWGFDFANEKPLQGTGRFAWQLVPAATVPVALRKHLMVQVQVPAAHTTYSQKIVVSSAVSSSSPETSKTQKRITEFLKPRKRLAASGKKSPVHAQAHKRECGGAHIRPPKFARMSSAAHSKRAP